LGIKKHCCESTKYEHKHVERKKKHSCAYFNTRVFLFVGGRVRKEERLMVGNKNLKLLEFEKACTSAFDNR
jgi:hypothetical protein